MPLDPNIYSQLQPNLAIGLGDIVNKYVDRSQADEERKNRLAQMAQAGELQGLQLQQAKQQAADEAAYRQSLKESGGDVTGLAQKLRAQGLHTQADALIKSQAEQQKASMEMGLKRHEGLATIAGDIANNPTQWQAVIQNSVKAGILHPDDAQTMVQHFSTLSPEQIVPEAQKGMVMVKDASAKMAEQLYPKAAQPSWHVIETAGGQQAVNLNAPNAPTQFGPKPKAAALGQEPPPKAAPGTRVYKDAEGNWQTEILKGSPQWQTQKSKEAADRAFVQNTVPTFEKNVKDIESLISDKGFESIFGLTGAYTPDITASARSARAKLDQVVGAMETSGYNMMKSTSGSAGSMSQQEWPKMQTYFNIIKNSSDPKQVKEALAGAMESYKRMQDIAKESYMNEWGTGQFGNPEVIKRLEEKTSPLSVTAPDGSVHVFPSKAAADGFRKAIGM